MKPSTNIQSALRRFMVNEERKAENKYRKLRAKKAYAKRKPK